MNTLPQIAQSGMAAAQTRLQASAQNVANLNTEGYRRELVTAQAQPGGGVQTSITQAERPGPDLVQDVVDQKMAALAFKANVRVFQTAQSLTGSLLDEKA